MSLLWVKCGDWINHEISSYIERDELFHKNQDVYAHLKVPGTNIDYPIAQHPEDDSYYLSHDFDQNETIYGAVFTEKVNRKDFNDPTTIIYGHSTLDGSMFGSLEWFESSDFFEHHKVIQIQTKDKKIAYEIFSAYSFTDDHLFHTFQLDKQTSRADYIKKIPQFARDLNGHYRDLTLTDKDKLLILSTCDIRDNGRRFVVHAKEKNRELDVILKS